MKQRSKLPFFAWRSMRWVSIGALILFGATIAACADSTSGTAPPPFNPDVDDVTPVEPIDPSDPEESCPLPNRSACEDTTLHYCEGVEVKSVECDELFPNATCIQAGINSLCSVAIDEECAVEANGRMQYARCAHSGMPNDRPSACVQTEFDGPHICKANVGNCEPNHIRGCLPGAEANRYYLQGCLNAQPRVLDCVAHGGVCTGTDCRHLPEGAVCETELKSIAKHLICGAGLRCHADSVLEEFGVCVPN